MKSFEFLREADDTDRYKMYSIQRGDTLGKLASRFDTTVDGLMWLNPQITNRDLIITGNTLRVPKTGGSSPVQPPPKPAPKPAEVDSDDISDEERAWLNMISRKESGHNYDIINYRAQELIDLGKLKPSGGPGEHPFANGFKVDGKEVEDPKKRFTAAGRYQFVWSTWKKAAELAGVDPKDFSPKNQDRAAIALAKYEYQRKFHRDLIADLQDPKFVAQAITGSTGPWSKAAGGPGFKADNYIAALDNLGRQTAEPKAKK